MRLSFSKKRAIIASVILALMLQILWIYPSYIQGVGNRRFIIICFFISAIFLYMKIELNKVVEGIISFLLFGVASYYLFDNLQSPFVGEILPGGIRLNYILIFLIMCVLFLISNSTRIAGILTAIFFSSYSILNMFVYYFRGRPIAPTDVHSARTALGVASNYSLWMNDLIVKDILLLFLLCVVFSTINFKIERIKIRAIVVIVGIIAMLTTILTVYDSDRLEERGFELFQFIPVEGVEKNGYLLDFYLNLQVMSVEKPIEYDASIVENLNLKYSNQLREESEKLPNILIIMNESFSDISCLGDVAYSEEPLDFYKSLNENTIKGNLLSSVYGGNTPNSEFECLTGGSMAFFPKDSIVYQNFLYDEIPSTVSLLANAGYYKLAMHPYNKIYWERNRVYPKVLKFDEFISQDEIKDPDIVREFISDKQVFDILLERMKTDGEDERLFNFTITMQNHGGYYFGMNDVNVPEINNPYVNEYLSLMKITDEAFEEFIAELENFDEPTIVCMFGDHQPGFSDEVYDGIFDLKMTEKEKEITKHIVPFVIWANYDIEEAEIPLTSINYLSPMILETAGVSLSPYYEYLLDLQEKYPVICSLGCFDSEMTFYTNGKEMDAISEINEYEVVQYNYLHDRNHRIDDFFMNK